MTRIAVPHLRIKEKSDNPANIANTGVLVARPDGTLAYRNAAGIEYDLTEVGGGSGETGEVYHEFFPADLVSIDSCNHGDRREILESREVITPWVKIDPTQNLDCRIGGRALGDVSCYLERITPAVFSRVSTPGIWEMRSWGINVADDIVEGSALAGLVGHTEDSLTRYGAIIDFPILTDSSHTNVKLRLHFPNVPNSQTLHVHVAGVGYTSTIDTLSEAQDVFDAAVADSDNHHIREISAGEVDLEIDITARINAVIAGMGWESGQRIVISVWASYAINSDISYVIDEVEIDFSESSNPDTVFLLPQRYHISGTTTHAVQTELVELISSSVDGDEHSWTLSQFTYPKAELQLGNTTTGLVTITWGSVALQYYLTTINEVVDVTLLLNEALRISGSVTFTITGVTLTGTTALVFSPGGGIPTPVTITESDTSSFVEYQYGWNDISTAMWGRLRFWAENDGAIYWARIGYGGAGYAS